jgi:hypothetical protein
MGASDRIVRWGGARVARKLAKSIPYVGAAVVVITFGNTIRRKGASGGLADATLNAIPFIGAAKNLVELARGKDFFPDRPERLATRSRSRAGR